ncbi:MAG: hypothetical protein QNJ46_10630 [Leptolyngbyaceae cyanobacterium MO_188.B28]|nr:hypothetical protein [Leptolyngbyaceae cyanobacterium MO_188.B28]
MTTPITLNVPLSGIILISCAKANAASGRATVARLCGYGEDVDQFTETLHAACAELGIEIDELGELLTD